MSKGKKVSSRERVDRARVSAEERRKIFSELCKHLRCGYSLDCFEALSNSSISSFLKEYPLEFVQEDFETALRVGKQGWENIGRRQSDGTCLGNSRSWYYNMSNRYGWRDKVDVEAEHSGSIVVQVVNYASQKPSQCTQSMVDT